MDLPLCFLIYNPPLFWSEIILKKIDVCAVFLNENWAPQAVNESFLSHSFNRFAVKAFFLYAFLWNELKIEGLASS